LSAPLNDSKVLLTGATGGIGHAIARALHARGAHLVVTGRRADVLEALRESLGDRMDAVVADLSQPGDVASLAARTDIDILVANAALPASGRLTGFTGEQVDRALDVNLRAPMQLTLGLMPAMLERGRGHFVFISSLAGKVAGPGSSVYSATKFGLRGFGYALGAELRGTGVGVTTVFPGFIRDAGMFADSGTKLPRGVGTRTPDNVAAAVVSGIEKDRAEVDVAPLSLSYGAKAFGVAPGVLTRVQAALGYDNVAAQMEEGQRHVR
jgi:short-subunit dehydrogenase